jgi:hypothetical protein
MKPVSPPPAERLVVILLELMPAMLFMGKHFLQISITDLPD